ncbi:MAG: hypothetical protein JWM98_10 [Thermoleophilia bacterium]|nr:hypothetical protein [Thermoleophilia bacterium]
MARYDDGGEEVRLAKAGSSSRSAASWLTTTPPRFVLPPSDQQPVRLVFDVPKDARPGGHYVAVNFTAHQEGEAGQQLTVDYSVPVYVLLTVSGHFARQLDVRLVPRDTWRWRGGHARWDLQLHNSGDVHENVSGRVHVDGLLAGSRSVAIDPGVLLPGEHRTQHVDVDLRDAPDVWRADADVRRDGAKHATADAARVVVLPWWLLVLAAAAVALVAWRVRAVRRQPWDGDEPFPPGT